MLWTIAVVLVILWLLGLVSGYTMGNFIHILLVIAIIVVLVRVMQGRKVVERFGPLPEKVRYLERRVVSRSRKILPKILIPSVEKVS